MSIGSNAQVSAANSVAIDANSVASQANTVSVGGMGSERRINNVAPGVNGTDAVNVDQLMSATGTINSVFNKVNKLDKRLDSVSAFSAAYSVLVPNGRTEGNTQFLSA